ncbi:MAG TPA: hypothetical protein VGL65_00065 [Gemmatimonadales bacterium]|jgi:hypothetical protein
MAYHRAILIAALSFSTLTAKKAAGQSPPPATPATCEAHDGMDHSSMDHNSVNHAGMLPANCGVLPQDSPQAAYSAIAEIVRLLQADSTTDWTRVNIEALRQHLIDMDDVTLRSAVTQYAVPGGLEMTITGSGRTADAIRRMVPSHSRMLNEEPALASSSHSLPNGVLLTVTATDPTDARTIAMIRGLGFAGLLTLGDHHASHHMALARGSDMPMQ